MTTPWSSQWVETAAADIKRCETALVRRCDERNVHALRVATRRARAFLWSLRPWSNEDIRDRCAGDLKRISARLAPMRNTDVAARFLTRIARKAGLTARQRHQLNDHLAREQMRERNALRAWVQSAEARRRIRSVCLALRRKSLLHDVDADTMARWQRRILRSVAKVDKRAQRVKLKELHSLRILAKRSHYVLEFLRAMAPRDDLQRMAELHASLGRYCDALLAVAWLKSHGEILGDELRKPLQRTARKIARRRARKSLRGHLAHSFPARAPVVVDGVSVAREYCPRASRGLADSDPRTEVPAEARPGLSAQHRKTLHARIPIRGDKSGAPA